jgi:hypothetical protein
MNFKLKAFRVHLFSGDIVPIEAHSVSVKDGVLTFTNISKEVTANSNPEIAGEFFSPSIKTRIIMCYASGVWLSFTESEESK